MATFTPSWRHLLVWLLLLIGLLWPALYNGQPVFYTDTGAYIRGADAGVQAVLHRRSPWSLSGENAIVKGPASADTPSAVAPSVEADSLSSIKDKTVLTGRSPYYGALLYLGEMSHGFWLTIALQSFAVLLSLTLLLRAARLPLWPQLPVIVGALTVGTSAPFFISFLMPDVFAGIAIMGCAVMLGTQERLQRIDYLGWFALLCAAALFHDSHVLIIGALLLLGVLRNLLRATRASWLGAAILVGALVVAELGQTMFSVIVERVVGVPPLRPPFLIARMIDDDPGVNYLRATCPGNGFKVCDYVDRLPMSSISFLWDSDTGPGIFTQASPARRRELSAEQYRFAFAVLKYDPWGELGVLLRDTGRELGAFDLIDFRYDAYVRDYFSLKIPAEHLTRLRTTAAWRQSMPTAVCAALIMVTFLAASVFLIVATRPTLARRVTAPVAAISIWMIIGVLINDAICAALSGPFSRFSARVEWLVPVAALLVAAKILSNREHPVA